MWDERHAAKPWQWFEDNTLGLLNAPVTYAPSGAPIYGTRLARHFYQQSAFEATARAIRRQQQQ